MGHMLLEQACGLEFECQQWGSCLEKAQGWPLLAQKVSTYSWFIFFHLTFQDGWISLQKGIPKMAPGGTCLFCILCIHPCPSLHSLKVTTRWLGWAIVASTGGFPFDLPFAQFLECCCPH